MAPTAARLAYRQRGAAAVEFALTIPLLMLMIVGIFEFGTLLMFKTTLSAAAKEGARNYAIYGSDTTGADTLGDVTRAVTSSALAAGIALQGSQILIDVCDQTTGNMACNNDTNNSKTYTLKDVATITSTSTLKTRWVNYPVCPTTTGFVVVQVDYSWSLMTGRLLSALSSRPNKGLAPGFTLSEASTMRCGG